MPDLLIPVAVDGLGVATAELPIIQAVRRLCAIGAGCRKEGGWRTDIGASVFVGEKPASFKELPAIWIRLASARDSEIVYGSIHFVEEDVEIRGFADIRSLDGWNELSQSERDIAVLRLMKDIERDIRVAFESDDSVLAELGVELRYQETVLGYPAAGESVAGCLIRYVAIHSGQFSSPQAQ